MVLCINHIECETSWRIQFLCRIPKDGIDIQGSPFQKGLFCHMTVLPYCTAPEFLRISKKGLTTNEKSPKLELTRERCCESVESSWVNVFWGLVAL